MTTDKLKIYQSTLSPITNPFYNGNPKNVKLFRHKLKYRLWSQGIKLGNGEVMNTPSRTNANVTKDMIFNNLQIEMEDTEQWDRNNVVNQSTQELRTTTAHPNA